MFTQMVAIATVHGKSYVDYPNHSFREAPAVAAANWVAENWGTFALTKRPFQETTVEETTPTIPGRLTAWFWERLIASGWFEAIGELDHRMLGSGYAGCGQMTYKNGLEEYAQPMWIEGALQRRWPGRRCEPWAAGPRGEGWGCIVLRDAPRDRWVTIIGRTDSGRRARSSGGRWLAPRVVEKFLDGYRFVRPGP
ncbi:hypothetical protein GCM10008101_08220 [Lysobacter xinjiangensis]|uniref:Beta-lactamase n=1 Tax=Cognatilysobacter xinjiangensis TaxID=546892 RepID=A0ABQ3BTJ8_9GAMM|nr:hypothetical protein [Lysobacter xinjiangensis]GGZ57068.1 hypothetical protein GCM10008101_08220 [Lysobacter xinjiangensis]